MTPHVACSLRLNTSLVFLTIEFKINFVNKLVANKDFNLKRNICHSQVTLISIDAIIKLILIAECVST